MCSIFDISILKSSCFCKKWRFVHDIGYQFMALIKFDEKMFIVLNKISILQKLTFKKFHCVSLTLCFWADWGCWIQISWWKLFHICSEPKKWSFYLSKFRTICDTSVEKIYQQQGQFSHANFSQCTLKGAYRMSEMCPSLGKSLHFLPKQGNVCASKLWPKSWW